MSTTKSYITIKGTKDGLHFYMSDLCSYQELIYELADKLEEHPHFLDGPLIRVAVYLGNRYLTREQENEIKDLIRSRGNIVVSKLESNVISKKALIEQQEKSNIQVLHKTIRSGQVIESKGHLLVLGDVNPGACLRANGHIYVLGYLRGMAHAGVAGDEQAIIAASILQPTQLRIANVVSRAPDDDQLTTEREFAYVEEGQICIDKIQHLSTVRNHFNDLINMAKQ